MATPPRDKLTFSQAQGLEPLPAPLRLGEVPKELRNALFAVVYDSMVLETTLTTRTHLLGRWRDIMFDMHVHLAHRPADEFDDRFEPAVALIKEIVFNARYEHVFDLLQFFVRHRQSRTTLVRKLNATFEQHGAAYRFVEPGPTIVPIATEEEGRAVQQSFAQLGDDEFSGARKHLRDAGMYLGQPGKEADSVRESIHAVEAVCKVLGEAPGATLTAALGKLKNKIPMHGSFVAALEKLYSYTNDEKGIRHALLDDEAHVDAADARFMFGACASFVSFLIGKAREAGLLAS